MATTRYRMSPWLTKMNILGVELTATDDGWFVPPNAAIEAAMLAAGAQPEGVLGASLSDNSLPAAALSAVRGAAKSVAHGKKSVLLESHNAAYFAEAQAEVVGSGGGSIVLDGGDYVLPESGWSAEGGLVSLIGNYSGLDISACSDTGLLITNTVGADLPRFRKYSDFDVFGDELTGRAGSQRAVRVHSATKSVRARLDSVYVSYAGAGISWGSKAYYTHGSNVHVTQCGKGLQQETGVTDNRENVSFVQSFIYNCDTLIYDPYGQRWRFAPGCSLVYGKTLFDLAGTGSLELEGVHVEWDYGKNSGETACPIRIAGTGGYQLKMRGGALHYNDSARTPYYPAIFQTESQQTIVTLDDVRAVNLGRDDLTVDDSLSYPVGGQGGTFRVRNLHSSDYQLKDLPSVVGYRGGRTSVFADGADPYVELLHRMTWSGGTAPSKVTSAENGVSPRSSGAMMKIPAGAGIVYIALPVYESRRRHAWSFFVETSAGVGSITISEIYATGVMRLASNGTTIELAKDARTDASSTYTIPMGVSGYRRVSWKQCNTNANLPIRLHDQFMLLKLDASALTSGAIYMDDVAYDPI